MIKTISLNGFEIKVAELGGDNTEIFNNSSEMVYASKLPNIIIGGDEVIAIPPGSIDGLYGTHGTIYLLGTGNVELRGVDHKITKARGQSVFGGGMGVSSEYVDKKCNELLDNAKAYSEVKVSDAVVSVKKYADDKYSEILAVTKKYSDSKSDETLICAKEYADSLYMELAEYIDCTDNDIYGLEADFENMSFTRLAGAVGKEAGNDFDSVNAYGGRRRCNLSDSGDVLAYYGDDNFKFDGSNGQVMVEQPKFYYRVVPLKTEKLENAEGYHLRKAQYYISDTPKAGFKIHPAFVRNGIEVDNIYLSAFEGSVYDVSASAYLLEDEQIIDFDNDKLSSIAGAKPCSGQSQMLTRANVRNLAHNRGTGWEQLTIQAVSAMQLLFIIEYASFNSQKNIGTGIVTKTSDNQNNIAEKTGGTLDLGNTTGKNSDNYISYRGVENVWGNIWYWIEGINVCNRSGRKYNELYIADHDFSDDTDKAPYLNASIYPVREIGFISAFGYSKEFDWIFIPTELIGNNVLPVGDYYINNGADWRCCVFGGPSYCFDYAGFFCCSFGNVSTDYSRVSGARLQYYPDCED